MATPTVVLTTRGVASPQRGSGRGALGNHDKGRKDMASGGKKTTMAKLARESRLRERRLIKQAKKEARKQAPSDHLDSPGGALSTTTTEAAQPPPGQAAALEPVAPPLAEVD